MVFRVHCYSCVQPLYSHRVVIMLVAVSTLKLFCGCHHYESLSIELTKGSVSLHFPPPPQNKQILLLVHSASLPDRFEARKATCLCCHTPHSHINQPIICFLSLARRLSVCLSVTVASDETHACQTQTGWHLQINQINLWRISSFVLETPMTTYWR